MAKYDWILIKTEYVEGIREEEETTYPTLKDLSKRHGVSYSYLRNKAAPKNENWEQEKSIYLAKLEQKIQDKKVLHTAGAVAGFSSKGLDAANLSIDAIITKFSYSDLSSHEIQKLTSSLKDAIQAGNLALGEPTEHTHTTGKTEVKMDHDINIPTDPNIRARGTALIRQIRAGQVESGDTGDGSE